MLARRLKGVVPALAVTSMACSPPPAASPAHRLVEKGPFQVLYAADGHLERVVYDSDGDHRAEVVTVFGPSGVPLRAQVDTDNDGIVDRWEYYAPDGRISKVGTARRVPGRPDLWTYPDGFGGISRKEYDDDGDGRPERAEDLLDGAVVAEEFDTDGDGRWDRRLVRGKNGSITRVDSDPDGDGSWRESRPVRP
jgi:hypothetical protein